MKLESLTLKNFMRFKELQLDFHYTVTESTAPIVFIGNNGAGKTSILESIVLGLSWLNARILKEKGRGAEIQQLEINNEADGAGVELSVCHKGFYHTWQIAKSRKGKKSELTSALVGVSSLADQIRTVYTESPESANLPLMAYYSTERVVLDIPLKIRTRHTFTQIDGYDGALSSGVNFRRFFEWYREREDKENETAPSQQMLEYLKSLTWEDESQWEHVQERLLSQKDRQLNAVRAAIEVFMGDFKNLRIKRQPVRMLVDKGGQELNVNQLSQGEKSLMALVGDISRRLSMMNPSLENPLHGEGIILIDEVDLHLHPRWQQTVLENLSKTFPNIQFIVTTHSPQVLSTTRSDLLYILDDGAVFAASSYTRGLDSATVLAETMGVNPLPMNLEINQEYLRLVDLVEADTVRAKQEVELFGSEYGVTHPSHLDLQRRLRLVGYKQRLAQHKG